MNTHFGPLVQCFLFKVYVDHRDLHSFPTRRSSDLQEPVTPPAKEVTSTCSRLYGRNARGASVYSHAILKVAEDYRSEEHTSELQSQSNLVCRLLLEKKIIVERDPSHRHSTAHHNQH